jgi:hypothetical protein
MCIQKRSGDGPQSNFLCRSGNTYPSVTINATATLLVAVNGGRDFRQPRRRSGNRHGRRGDRLATSRRYSTTPAQQFNATSHLRLSTTTTRVDGLNIVSPRKTQWDHRPNRTTAWFSHNRNRPKGKSFIATERHIFSVCRSDRAALFRAMGELFRRIEPWLRNVM